MTMRWQDERYVRVYTRDTPDWLSLSFLAQGLFLLLLRKVDRAGILALGRHGRKGAAIAIGHAHEWNRLDAALAELEDDGCVIVQGDRLVVPNFIEAQETPASDRLRQREHRAKARIRALGTHEGVEESRNVTERHEEQTQAKPRDETSRNVTASTARHGSVQHGSDRLGAVDGRSTVTSLAAAPLRQPGED